MTFLQADALAPGVGALGVRRIGYLYVQTAPGGVSAEGYGTALHQPGQTVLDRVFE